MSPEEILRAAHEGALGSRLQLTGVEVLDLLSAERESCAKLAESVCVGAPGCPCEPRQIAKMLRAVWP